MTTPPARPAGKHEQMTASERRAEHAARFLAASEALGSSLDYETTLERVARLVVPEFADLCIVDVLDEPQPRTVVAAPGQPEVEAQVAEIRQRFPLGPDQQVPLTDALRRDGYVLNPAVTDETLARLARDPQHLALLRRLGHTSELLVPLVARGEILGVMGFAMLAPGRRLGAEDVALAQELAQHAAQAIDNARLYRKAQESEARARAQAARMAALAEASRRFAEAPLEQREVLATVAHQVGELMGDLCVVRLLSDDGTLLLPTAAYHPDPEALALAWEVLARTRVQADTGTAGQVIQTGDPVFIPAVTSGDLSAFDPANQPYIARYGVSSLMMVPLRARGRVLGVISVAQERPGPGYTLDDLALLQELANRAALAVDNVRLLSAERVTRAAAEAAERRVTFLAEAGAVLTASLDFEATLAGLARLAVPIMADLCVVDLIAADGSIYRPAAAHLEPAKAELALDIARRFPRTLAADTPLAHVLRAGTPAIVPAISPELRSAVGDDRTTAQAIEAAGFDSALVVPLIAREQTLGAITFISETAERYTEADLILGQQLADRAAVAIQNARLYHDVQQAETRYRTLFEGAADAVVLVDTAGRITDANPTALQLLGYRQEELRALSIQELADSGLESSGAAWEYWRTAGGPSELELRRADGAVVPVEASVREIQLPGGAAYLAHFRDISERRRLDRMQQEFVAMVTHELKGPLTSLRGFAQLMQRRQTFSARGIEVILAQADQLERLVSDLLDAARLNAGRLELRRAPVDLNRIVLAAAERAQAETQLHVIAVETAARPQIGDWDADRVTQVLHNLLSNAVKYSPDSGDILVRVEELGEAARVTVRDQGIGIPAAAQERLFSRFYRVENVRGSTQGLGLGLYISRSLVEAHGGQIGVESAPGQGSVFAFTLPLVPAAMPAAHRLGPGADDDR